LVLPIRRLTQLPGHGSPQIRVLIATKKTVPSGDCQAIAWNCSLCALMIALKAWSAGSDATPAALSAMLVIRFCQRQSTRWHKIS
jgi:hypothetical protein